MGDLFDGFVAIEKDGVHPRGPGDGQDIFALDRVLIDKKRQAFMGTKIVGPQDDDG